MTKIESKEDIVSLIRKLYVSTYIHACLDCDVTCAGNGVNSHEALNVYRSLARDIGISTEKPTIEELKTLENDPYYQEIVRECGYEKLTDLIK